MKIKLFITASLYLSFVSLMGSDARAAVSARWGSTVEIPVEGFLSPAKGFEDKNNVEGVLYGFLPNACYKLSKPEVSINPDDQNKIMIKQFAIRKTDDPCLELQRETSLDPALNIKIPFVTEVFMGMLTAGNYKVAYHGIDGDAFRDLEVAKATNPDMDEFPYANVSNAVTTEVLSTGDEIKVTLSGVFNSSCTSLDRVEFKKVDDVYVVLPILKKKKGMCIYVLTPFEEEINLGTAEKGTHLIHVRSMNGKAVNRLFRVNQ